MTVDFSQDIKTAERQMNSYINRGQKVPSNVLAHYNNLLSGTLNANILYNLNTNNQGSSDFINLTDTPIDYSGSAGQTLIVNANEDALEFAPLASGLVLLDEDDLISDSDSQGATQQSLKAYIDNSLTNLNGLTGLRGAPVSSNTILTALIAKDYERRKVQSTGNEYVFKLTADLTPTENSNINNLADDANTGKWVLEESNIGVVDFSSLIDTPSTYIGQAGKILSVNNSEDSLEFIDAPIVITDFSNLTDTPNNYTNESGKFLIVNNTEDGLEFADAPATLSEFSALDDTPNDFTGEALKLLRVNSTEDGVEYVDAPSVTPSAIIDVSNEIFGITATGTSVIYNSSNPSEGQTSVNSLRYYDEGSFRYLEVGLITDDDTLLVWTINTPSFPVGGVIVDATLSWATIATNVGNSMSVGVDPSTSNQFTTNRSDSLNNDISFRVWLKVYNPNGGIVSNPEIPANNTGVQDGDTLVWNSSTNQYEPQQISLPLAPQPLTVNEETITTNKILAASDPIYQHILSNTPNLEVSLPPDPINGTKFLIKSNPDSTQNFTVIGGPDDVFIGPNNIYEVIYTGTVWMVLGRDFIIAGNPVFVDATIATVDSTILTADIGINTSSISADSTTVTADSTNGTADND